MKHLFNTISLPTLLLMSLHTAYALPQGAPNANGPALLGPASPEQMGQSNPYKKNPSKNPQAAEMMQQLDKTQKVLPNLQTNQ